MQQRVFNPPAVYRLLAPLSFLYGGAMRCRNLYYDRVRGAARPAGVPVISVGNITVGGTGKTPLVIEIVRRLCRLGRRPAILTRGYRGARDRPADEVLELRDALPDVPVVVNPDRRAGAAAARAQHGADCLVLDDGFQHRRLRRDLDIVVIDALAPWGGGRVLPAGRLREPLGGLARAHAFVVSRCNQVDPAALAAIDAALRRYAPGAALAHARVEVERLVALAGGPAEPGELAARRVLPVCGIGNPHSFQHLLDTLGGHVGPPLLFRDHHRYRPGDVAAIARVAREQGADVVVTTRKDWVKLAALWRRKAVGGLPPLARLDVRLVLADGADTLDDRLKQAVERAL